MVGADATSPHLLNWGLLIYYQKSQIINFLYILKVRKKARACSIWGQKTEFEAEEGGSVWEPGEATVREVLPLKFKWDSS